MPGDRFAILFVCHANICRSPMAERLARRTLGADVSSAGTHAWHGAEMHEYTRQILAERGAGTTPHASRPLVPELLAAADLVLTMSRNQRAAAVTLLPAAARRTFTLRQFGRLAAATGPGGGDLRGLLDRVRGVREQPVGPEHDELVDPVSGPVEGFRACADEIQRVLDVIARA
ncbi:MAG TPA: low molecular weight phosphatase family protein [Rugosimonospora sp.]|nr:low molecular weight phosphatase family protein [Rugosimonospora sp.]